MPTGDDLERLLHDATLEFVGETRNVKIDHANRKIVLSEIFEMYRSDFVNDLRRRGIPGDRGVIDYVANVAPPELGAAIRDASGYDVEFSAYDWSINSQQL